MSDSKTYELAVVMPVYNEEGCIVDVLRSWLQVLESLKINFVILPVNDGSTDKTAELLNRFEDNPSVRVFHKKNSGHGPTVLYGYRKAADLAVWVFQCDADNEIHAEDFPLLWEKRRDNDVVMGRRINRKQNMSRRIISMVSRGTIFFFFGRKVRDVNVPFRLIPSRILSPLLDKLPEDVLVPNVILSGLFTKMNIGIQNIDVPCYVRTTGRISLVNIRLWIFAVRSFLQTVRLLHAKSKVCQ